LNEVFYYADGFLHWKIKTSQRAKVGDRAGTIANNGYWTTKYSGKLYLNHRIIFAMHHGYWPELIDHIDGNPLNNDPLNLREASKSQNAQNAKLNKNNKSGIKGVYFDKTRDRWSVRANNKLVGRFKDLELAELVSIEIRNLTHGDFARMI
jgi:hypothetical protein